MIRIPHLPAFGAVDVVGARVSHSVRESLGHKATTARGGAVSAQGKDDPQHLAPTSSSCRAPPKVFLVVAHRRERR